MLSALLVLTLAADPNAAVVLARRTGVAPGEAAALTDKVTTRLKLELIVPAVETKKRLAALGLKDITTCNGGADCHVEVGKQLKVEWLVLVSVSQIAKDQSLALELFSVKKAEVVERESLLLAKRGDVSIAQLEAFAAKTAARVTEVEVVVEDVKPVPVDAPVVLAVVPVEPQPVVIPVKPVELPRSHAGTFILGGFGVVALGTAIGLLINGLVTRAPLFAGNPGMNGVVLSELRGAKRSGSTTARRFSLVCRVRVLRWPRRCSRPPSSSGD